MLRINPFCLYTVVFLTFAVSASAEQNESTVVFEDSFDREGEVGNDWKLNEHEAHQFVLKDGAVHLTRNTEAKHSANMLHKAEFRNGTLAMRFKLVHEGDSFLLQFRDSAVTEVKQGMLFNVRIGEGQLQLDDAVVAYGIKQKMKAAKTTEPSPEQQAELDKVTVAAPIKLSVGEWHTMLVHVQGNKLTVSIDGKEVVSLSSEAIGHAKKDNFRLEVKPTLVVDEIKLSRRG